MKENKVKKQLLDECLAYRVYGQDINPIHAENMIKRAYKAGYEQAIERYGSDHGTTKSV
jgi:hypothetical protein